MSADPSPPPPPARPPRPPRPFLTAVWRNLLVVTYAVPDRLLAGRAPGGLVLDRLHGQARVSFVAFEFARTRVFGMAIPGHTTFPEINLRFYVRCGPDRGIVFLREFVPRRAVAVVARAGYNEPYSRIPMHSYTAACGSDGLRIGHLFGRDPSRVTAEVDARGTVPPEGSDERWLTHQSFGFGQTHRGAPRQYRVEHPLWALHPIRDLELSVDFERFYGPDWAFLADAAPSHVTFAAGSAVAVFPPGRRSAAG